MQQRLPRNRRKRFIVQLFPVTFAELHEHADMPPIASPAFDLPLVILASPAERVAAVPLKPAERIALAQPLLGFPLAIASAPRTLKRLSCGSYFFSGNSCSIPSRDSFGSSFQSCGRRANTFRRRFPS